MLGAAIIKDLQLLLRDRGALASLFLLPIIFVAAFGSIMSGGGNGGQGRTLPVYYDASAPSGPMAAGLLMAIDGSGGFRARMEPSADAVRALVAADDEAVGLIFPPDFDPRAGRPAELVIDEASPAAFRGPIQGTLDSILLAAYLFGPNQGSIRMLAARTPPGLDKPLAAASGFQISVPGNAVLFGFFLALTVGLSFSEERRSGTWRRLLAAPVSRPVLLMAKLVPYAIVGLVQMAFLFGVGARFFQMKVAGSMLALVVLTIAVVICATTLGLFFASFSATEKQLGGMGSISLLVMGIFGGAMVPRAAMPATMQSIGLATPHGWALEGYHSVLVREGTSLPDIWLPVVVIIGFAALFAIAGMARFRFER